MNIRRANREAVAAGAGEWGEIAVGVDFLCQHAAVRLEQRDAFRAKTCERSGKLVDERPGLFEGWQFLHRHSAVILFLRRKKGRPEPPLFDSSFDYLLFFVLP